MVVALGVALALGAVACGNAPQLRTAGNPDDDPGEPSVETPTTTGPGPGANAATAPHLDTALASLDDIVGHAMTATGIPGVSVAVVADDQVVALKGYGVREEGKPDPVDAQTVFQLASLSKPISSTALAALVGKGVIGWDEPVQPFNPDLVLSDPYVTDHVTFADLYSHRSGIPGSAGNDLEEIGYGRDEILRRLRFEPLHPFRTTYDYSNFAMTAAGDAAAKAAGTTFDDLMDNQLFGPAGMTSSSARYSDFIAHDNRATLHARIDGQWKPDFVRQPDAQAPAGGISSNVTDLAQWLRLQLAGGSLGGTPIVGADALAQTHVPHITSRPGTPAGEPASFYGLGWSIEQPDDLGYVRWSHSGAFSVGASTNATLIPALHLGIVVLTNGLPIGVPEAIAYNFLDVAVAGHPLQDWLKVWGDRFAGLFVPDPALETPPASPAPAQPDRAYVGTYANDYFGAFEVVSQAGGGLAVIAGPAKVTMPLTHWDGDVFTLVTSPELPNIKTTATFTIGADGQASTLTIAAYDPTGLGTLTRVP